MPDKPHLPSITAIAGDAGGAAALAPVLRRMAEDRMLLDVLGYREAPATWRAAGVPCTEIPETADDAWLTDRMRGALLTLTSTSVNGIDWEKRAVALAANLGIPSLALLDFWSNYRARFEAPAGTLVLPDRIAVMDELARNEMASEGFPGERLVVTGQPVFDALQERRTNAKASQYQSVRADLGIEGDTRLVLFASQPLADVHGGIERVRAIWGYDERQVFELCRTALLALANRRHANIVMAVRPHPREPRPLTVTLSGSGFRCIPWQSPDRLDAVLAADVVLGINSMLLMEAVLLGRIVVSVQPDLRIADPLPSNRDGRSIAVTSADVLEGVLDRALFDASWRRGQLAKLELCGTTRSATDNVLALINQLIAA